MRRSQWFYQVMRSGNKEEAPDTSFNYDPRYGQKDIKSGDPDPMIAHAMRRSPKGEWLKFKAKIGFGKIRYVAIAVMAGTMVFLVLPSLSAATKDNKNYGRFALEHAGVMPNQSTDWWQNEWRKGATWWRHGEAHEGFHVPNFQFIEAITGKDMLSPVITKPQTPPRKALVPLCGDSPIIRVLATAGYQVHGVEFSENALQALVKQLNIYLPLEKHANVVLHWCDFFSPELWSILPSGLSSEQKEARQRRKEDPFLETDYKRNASDLAIPDLLTGLKGEKFHLIYDRQALSTFPKSNRDNYAFLLKKALRDDGIVFIEGIHRTGRVKGNKVAGPPFQLEEPELRTLFPESEGFFVKCDTSLRDRVFSLDKESRILGRIPKEYFATEIPCVVSRSSPQH